jgi:alpha-amylase/alpha-mannosidase (GH57 family)
MVKGNKYVCIHGHFYQPPRENAWLDVVELQPSAHPFHDWNERINDECYAPNATARVLDPEGNILKIQNNYDRISFNFGPTLLSWLEQHDPETYQQILAADKKSIGIFDGHGSAMAQAYNHIILPLANIQDKITQVKWGIQDFERRFNRSPEGMWLPETAVNSETLEVLASHGIKFTILAPRQAKCVRKFNSQTDWEPVTSETINTRTPYWCELKGGNKIALFFYNGQIAQEVAFEGLLNNGSRFANRMLSGFSQNDTPELAHVATDGESYGHHHRFGEMALADCLNRIENSEEAEIINYSSFLSKFPPQWEVIIHENSSWSCIHGVERWRDDCSCHSGANPTWNQKWRKPLRESLDWLREQGIQLFEKEGRRFLKDPWNARNCYLHLMSDRSDKNLEQFLNLHCRRQPNPVEKILILRLLEIQKHAQLMYTSCGWFFDEISGLETNQILQYALRLMDYLQEVSGKSPHQPFLEKLSKAPSNVYENGSTGFTLNVTTSRVTLSRVAMHFAVASLFSKNSQALKLNNYTATVRDFKRAEAGTMRFATARICIQSKISTAQKTFSIAALYMGQQQIIGNLTDNMKPAAYESMQAKTHNAFENARIGEITGLLQDLFGPAYFTFDSLFTDEQILIIEQLAENNLKIAITTLQNVFDDNFQLMTAIVHAGGKLPESWKNIAACVLNAKLLDCFTNQELINPAQIRQITRNMKIWSIPVSDQMALNHAVGNRISKEFQYLENKIEAQKRLTWICEVLQVIQETAIRPELRQCQNQFYHLIKNRENEIDALGNTEWEQTLTTLSTLLKVKI